MLVTVDEMFRWGLFTPRGVNRIAQTTHYAMIWDGAAISSVNQIIRR